jgi:hypothetical protein
MGVGLCLPVSTGAPLPQCQYEDGSGNDPLPCRWYAGDVGNGIGESFTVSLVGLGRGGERCVAYIYDHGIVEYAWVDAIDPENAPANLVALCH